MDKWIIDFKKNSWLEYFCENQNFLSHIEIIQDFIVVCVCVCVCVCVSIYIKDDNLIWTR